MPELIKIPNEDKITWVEYTPKYAVICLIGRAPFHGKIRVTYCPEEWLLEFKSFEAFLRSIAMDSFTIESLARFIYEALIDLLGDVILTIGISAKTTVHGRVEVEINNRRND